MKTKRIQKISLVSFFVCMIICAGLVIFMIWNEPKDFGIVNKLAFTFFVFGLASFLTWITNIILEVKGVLKKSNF